MDENGNRKEAFADRPEVIDGLRTRFRAEKDALQVQEGKPESHWGAQRFRVMGVTVTAPDAVSEHAEPAFRLPGSLNSELVLATDTMSGLDQDLAPAHYVYAKNEILKAWPDVDPTTLAAALMDLVPHVLRVVACIWHEDRVLMELKWRYGAPEPLPGKPHILKSPVLPSERIGFPYAPVLLHDGPETVFANLVEMPFILTQRRHDCEPYTAWMAIMPDRPEVLLVRHTALHGRPREYFQVWQEEGVFPYVFVPLHVLMPACEGDMDLLKRVIDFTHVAYDKAARALDKKTRIDEVCGQCGKPTRVTYIASKPPRMLNYDPALAVDAVSTDAFLSAIALMLGC